ncbi:MAG: hypothetical protein O7E52_10900 [Candidatus Poribacteria bacterium]|nr:hypothetical protein [Candidatus Poribacteria bacterium]
MEAFELRIEVRRCSSLKILTTRGPWDDWERRTPQEVGMDASMLDAAIDYARARGET